MNFLSSAHKGRGFLEFRLNAEAEGHATRGAGAVVAGCPVRAHRTETAGVAGIRRAKPPERRGTLNSTEPKLLNQILKPPLVGILNAGYQLCLLHGKPDDIDHPLSHIGVFLIYDVQLVQQRLQGIIAFRKVVAPELKLVGVGGIHAVCGFHVVMALRCKMGKLRAAEKRIPFRQCHGELARCTVNLAGRLQVLYAAFGALTFRY